MILKNVIDGTQACDPSITCLTIDQQSEMCSFPKDAPLENGRNTHIDFTLTLLTSSVYSITITTEGAINIKLPRKASYCFRRANAWTPRKNLIKPASQTNFEELKSDVGARCHLKLKLNNFALSNDWLEGPSLIDPGSAKRQFLSRNTAT